MKVTFIIANTYATECSIVHENEWRPYPKRTVTIELTSKQCEQLRLKKVGSRGQEPVFEEIHDCFVEGGNHE